jgi:MFS family permease
VLPVDADTVQGLLNCLEPTGRVRAPRRRWSVRSAPALPVLQAVSVTILGVLPPFLVGALAVQLRADLGIGLGALGLATAALFAVSGSLSRPFGALVQRVGSARGMAVAALLSGASLAGVGLAGSYAALLAALVVGGVGNALAQPAANMRISELAPGRRLGLAFGIKQSSIPAATLLGGLAVPGIALLIGWRWAPGIAALLAMGVAAWASRASPVGARGDGTEEPDRGLPRGGLLVLTVGGGLGAAAATSLGVFLVDSGVAAGLSHAHAGLLFAAASLLGLGGRIGVGWLADRRPRQSHYLVIANLLSCGAVGYGLLALGAPSAFVLGALLSYGAGWTWTGLFHFAIVKDNRLAAASATGFVQTGLSLGAAIGPLAFGAVAELSSYQTAWLATAALSLAGALAIRAGRRMVRRSRGLPVAGLGRRAPAAVTLGRQRRVVRSAR